MCISIHLLLITDGLQLLLAIQPVISSPISKDRDKIAPVYC